MKIGIKLGDVRRDALRRRTSASEVEALFVKMSELVDFMFSEIFKVIVGQREVIEEILISLLSKGHSLIEGYPGLGKTLMVKVIAEVMNLKFSRIQCTPDLMPSDIIGTYLIEEENGKKVFRFQKGPIFTNILLADEINRATPKTQSALLESMQEKQVSVGNETIKLEEPFFVLATQNPIEMEGTYPLPEAQLDRFLLKINVKYPSKEEEEKIVDIYATTDIPQIKKIIRKRDVLMLQELTRRIPISKENKRYAIDIVSATRPEFPENEIAKEYLDYGASPRASIGLVVAAKARALINGREYVTKEDIEKMSYPVLRHRIILNFESERKGVDPDRVIEKIIKEVKKS